MKAEKSVNAGIPGLALTNRIHMKGAEKVQAKIVKMEQPCESKTFTKRIGSTTYRVRVYFSRTSRETVNDKILRLIKNDVVRQ